MLYQWISYLVEKVFTHTHALHELSNLCKISIYREFLCWLNSELSFISLHIFEMLSDCFIRGLYMRVLKLTLGKIIFCKFSFSFCFSVWSVQTVSPCVWTSATQMAGQSGYTFGRVQPVSCLCGNARPDELMICPDGDPTGYISHVQP